LVKWMVFDLSNNFMDFNTERDTYKMNVV